MNCAEWAQRLTEFVDVEVKPEVEPGTEASLPLATVCWRRGHCETLIVTVNVYLTYHWQLLGLPGLVEVARVWERW